MRTGLAGVTGNTVPHLLTYLLAVGIGLALVYRLNSYSIGRIPRVGAFRMLRKHCTTYLLSLVIPPASHVDAYI